MQFSEIVGAIRRRWIFAVVPLILSGVLGLVAVSTAPVIYQASAQVYVSLPNGKSATDLNQGATYAQQQLSSYAQLATSTTVLEPVIKELGLPTTPKALARDIQATASKETVILDIRVRSASPETAAEIANSVARELAAVVDGMSPKVDGQASVEIIPISPATPPLAPVSPEKKRDLAASLLGGLLLGILAAVIRDRTDTSVHGRKDLPAGVNVLGSVPLDKAMARGNLVSITSPQAHVRAEAYRRIRTTLKFTDFDRPVRVLTVTSSLPGEGKSTTALNLAQVFAGAGNRVLLVDADLRKPRLADYLGIVGSVGLVDVLIGTAKIDDVLQNVLDGRLTVLPAGSIPPNPSELLGSRSMAALMATLRERFDVIIMDTPPLTPVIDAAVLTPLTDGTIVVARYRKVRRAQLESTVQALTDVNTRILGVVMTCARRVKTQHSGYGYYHSGPPVRPGAVTRPRPTAPAEPVVQPASPERSPSSPTRSASTSSTSVRARPKPAASVPQKVVSSPSDLVASSGKATVTVSNVAVTFSQEETIEVSGVVTDTDITSDHDTQIVDPRRPVRPVGAGPRFRRSLWSIDHSDLDPDDDFEGDDEVDEEVPEDSTQPRRRSKRAAAN